MSKLNRYAVVIGDNPELSVEVQRAINEAYDESYRVNGKNMICFINTKYNGSLSISDKHVPLITSLKSGLIWLTPSDVLDGKAFELDGAKKPEPRYFLCLGGPCPAGREYGCVLRHDHGNEFLIWDKTNYQTKSKAFDIGEVDDEFPEITAEDVAYIRDNAERAKELGMALGKPKTGDDWIGKGGQICCEFFATSDLDGVAGHRYCSKATKQANFCSECGTKL